MKLSKQEQRIYDLLQEKPRTAREIIYYGGTNWIVNRRNGSLNKTR